MTRCLFLSNSWLDVKISEVCVVCCTLGVGGSRGLFGGRAMGSLVVMPLAEMLIGGSNLLIGDSLCRLDSVE